MPRHQITLHWPIVEFQGASNKQKKSLNLFPPPDQRQSSVTFNWTKIFKYFFNDLSEVPQMCLKRIINKK